MRNLSRLLNPTTIAAVGAAADPRKVRGMVIPRLQELGIAGTIYPVNPGYQTIYELPVYPSVTAIEGPVDVVIVAVAAEQLVPALRGCVDKGVGAAVILSGLPGGAEGTAVQDKMRRSRLRTA